MAFPSSVCPEEGWGWDPSAAERGDREEPDAVGPGPGPLRHGGRREGQILYLVNTKVQNTFIGIRATAP